MIPEAAERIAVLGGGSWGATLAVHLHAKGNKVVLWEYYSEFAARLDRERIHPYLPHLEIPREIPITSRLEEAIRGSTVLVFAVPSQAMRNTAKEAERAGPSPDAILVSAAKGIENNTLCRMSEILAQELPAFGGRIAALSGPTHAEEVSRKVPTSAVVAGSNEELCRRIQDLFAAPWFRLYTNPDVTGVELGGALKNVIAIAAGICDGLGLGDNTKAALLTRGLAEITRLGVSLGASASTFLGLSGMGDLIVTCLSRHSRNRLLGEKIGSGKSAKQALSEMTMVAEGYATAKSAYDISRRQKVEMPISERVYRVLYEGLAVREAIESLLSREMKSETEGLP